MGNSSNPYKKVVVRSGQTGLDVCLENYGCIDALLQLVGDNLNVFTSIDMIPRPGSVLKVLAVIPVYNSRNVAVAAEYASKNYLSASGFVYTPASASIITEGGFEITTEQGQQINMEAAPITDENNNDLLTEDQQNLGG